MKLDLVSTFRRYALSSGLTWFVDFIVFMSLFSNIGIPLALLVSRCAAGVVGFISHKKFSFNSGAETSRREVIGYVALAAANYLISVGLFIPFFSDGALHAAMVKIAVEIAIFVINFLFLRRLFLPNLSEQLG
ncbi:GtrA family protein [Aminobacter sp. LjRoot7]|uniref:GtrA family protein n=1 Tax=Aminobacter sp. LjRoot7 TaxID=3342335 RepID=UPI003ED01CBF